MTPYDPGRAGHHVGTPVALDARGRRAYPRAVADNSGDQPSDGTGGATRIPGKRRPPSDQEQQRRQQWGKRTGALVREAFQQARKES